MTNTFYIKRNDTRPEINIIVIDESSGNPLNLTGATATFSMKKAGASAPKITRAAAQIADAAAGKVKYSWATGDTNDPGIYRAEFEVTFSGGGKATFPGDGYIEVHILEDVDNL